MSRKNKGSEEKTPLTDVMLEKIIIKAVLLFFAAVLVYIPAMNGGYIYDDDTLLYNNPAIRAGEGGWNLDAWKGLWAFWYPFGDNANVAADYAPLADTTLWLEFRFWGNNGDETNPEHDKQVLGWGSPGYHITNVVLHATAALLLWYLLAQIAIPGAWLIALVWAVHPVCVESVAWIAERRNPLSMVLYLLTMINWFKFQRTRRWGVYSLAVFLFVLTMFAKTSIVMLPVLLLLCVWWLRNRITESDLWEAAPFFLISLIFGIITIYFQNFRAINKEFLPILPMAERIPGACFALGFYFYKILVPLNLNLIYEQWHRILPHLMIGQSPDDVLVALNDAAANHKPLPPYSIIGLAKELIIGVNFAAFFYWAWCRRSTWGRQAIFGLGSFAIMIFPVLGFTRMAYMRLTLMSDHFQYAPMVGVIALVVAGLVQVYHRLQPVLRPVLVAVGAGFIGIFCCLTWQRADAFSEPKKLWVDNVTKNPQSWQGHSHLGAIYWKVTGVDVPDALHEWELSVKFAPYLYETHNNYALALNATGLRDEALAQYKIAVTIDPEQFRVRTNYANALLSAGQQAQAARQLQLATGFYEESIRQYQEVLKYDREDPWVYNTMGVPFLNLGRVDDAIQCFQHSLDIYKRFLGAAAMNYPIVQQVEQNLEKAVQIRKVLLEAPPVTPQSTAPAPQTPAPKPAASPAPSSKKTSPAR